MSDAFGSAPEAIGKQILDGIALTELLTHVGLLVECGHSAQACDVLTEARLRFPDCPRTAYLLGCQLLDAGKPEGLDHLKFAMAQDETATTAVCERAMAFLNSCGEAEAAAGYRNRLASWQSNPDTGPRLSEQVSVGDRLEPVSTEQREEIQGVLSSMQCGLMCAYVVQKSLPEWMEKQPIRIIVCPRRDTRLMSSDHVTASIEQSLSSRLQLEASVQMLTQDDNALLEQLRCLQGAILWDHGPASTLDGRRSARG